MLVVTIYYWGFCMMQGEVAHVVEYRGNMKHTMLRALQQSTSLNQSGEVAYVDTAEALRAAVLAGAQHIEIRDHLDLTSMQASDSPYVDFLTVLQLAETTVSIRVRSRSLRCASIIASATVYHVVLVTYFFG
jgi:hypothetical protein